MGEKKLEWINLDKAELLLKDYVCRGTIYNKISQKKLAVKGSRRERLVEKSQLLRVFNLEGVIE